MELYQCKNCESLYYPSTSTSSLRMTYCNTICEVNDLGFHLKSFEEGRYYYEGAVDDVNEGQQTPNNLDELVTDFLSKHSGKDNDDQEDGDTGRDPVPV